MLLRFTSPDDGPTLRDDRCVKTLRKRKDSKPKLYNIREGDSKVEYINIIIYWFKIFIIIDVRVSSVSILRFNLHTLGKLIT